MEPIDRAQRIAGLKAARDVIDREIELLAGEPVAPAIGDPEWVNLATAAHHCGSHPDRMARLARSHGLGRRVGRDWRIDMNRVRAWQEGRPFPPLPWDIVGNHRDSSDVSDGVSASS